MKDIVVGTAGGYTWDQAKPWANSLRRSGFDGDKLLLVYGNDPDFIAQAKDEGFKVRHVHCNHLTDIYWQRFHDIWALDADLIGSRYVIATDVRDVVFQTNPSEWLTRSGHGHIIAASESIRLGDEKWNYDSTALCFGQDVADSLKSVIVCNSGVIAGKWGYLRGLFLQMNLLCRGVAIATSDQPAFNVLIHSAAYRSLVQIADLNDGWCCNVGVAFDPEKRARMLLPDDVSQYGPTVKTKDGRIFAILHQYDREPTLAQIVKEKFA